MNSNRSIQSTFPGLISNHSTIEFDRPVSELR
jgi:hypothetical protein